MKLTDSNVICLGIDPGLGRLGYGIVLRRGHSYESLSYGCIETPPKTDIAKRLKTIYQSIAEKIHQWEPDFLSIEQLFFGRNTTTAGYVWQARGTILLLASQNNLPYYEPKPNQIKMTVCGNGSADKTQIQKMVKRLLNLKEIPRPDDAADALAIAITGLALDSFSRKTGKKNND